jgi:hypothetical protein
MPTIEEVKAWMVERSAKDRRLYERHGRPLEAAHTGEFVAISDDGKIILGFDYLTVSKEAVRRFGGGNFALRKIGANAEFHLRSLAA